MLRTSSFMGFFVDDDMKNISRVILKKWFLWTLVTILHLIRGTFSPKGTSISFWREK